MIRFLLIFATAFAWAGRDDDYNPDQKSYEISDGGRKVVITIEDQWANDTRVGGSSARSNKPREVYREPVSKTHENTLKKLKEVIGKIAQSDRQINEMGFLAVIIGRPSDPSLRALQKILAQIEERANGLDFQLSKAHAHEVLIALMEAKDYLVNYDYVLMKRRLEGNPAKRIGLKPRFENAQKMIAAVFDQIDLCQHQLSQYVVTETPESPESSN